MPRLIGCRRRLLCLAGAAVLAACGNPPDDSPEQRTSERLVGTWLREYRQQDTAVRRVLVLSADGRFQERSEAKVDNGLTEQHTGAGQWLYDGTNLKRRYTELDGKQPAAPTIPFVTFQLRFSSPDAFTGVDNVRKLEVSYRRVAEGTTP
jgi:hypothetical protein